MSKFYELDGLNIVNINEIAMLEINSYNTNLGVMSVKIHLKSGTVISKEVRSDSVQMKYYMNLRELLLGGGVKQ